MRTRRLGLLLALAGALFWLGQGMWAAPGTGAPASAPTVEATAATANAAAVVTGTPVTTAAATAAAPAPDGEGESGALIPSRPVLGATLAAAAQGQGQGKGQVTRDQVFVKKFQRVAPSELKAAAKRARAMGMKPGVAGATTFTVAGAPLGVTATGVNEGPGGLPHYFGPYGNWAFSPLPSGGVSEVTILDPGTGYNNPIIVIDDAYGTGESVTIPTTATDGAVNAPAISSPVGVGITAPVATVIDDPALCGGVGQLACGTGALADALIGGTVTGGIRKFVDGLPGVGLAGANNLGQYLPLAIADETRYPGADYYEIALVEYTEQMHSDLPGPFNAAAPGPATRLRGYVQIVPAGWTGTDALGNTYDAIPLTIANGLTQDVTIGGIQAYGATKPHYLGPIIIAKGRVHGIEASNPGAGKERPVRVTFYNLLPTGSGGDLFIPVDDTVPGAGPAPDGTTFTQNRATIHLHGNNTVWLSDGNVHQWITPATETTNYPAGVSARNVPDMDGCAPDAANPLLPGNSGCMTMYYTNAQSARLQFYHDHAHGITRLNVYAGEAAGYLVTDAVETDMAAGTDVTGVNPGFLKVLPPDNGGLGIPLVIQDKTFVQADTVFAQDPTWNAGTGPRDLTTGNITGAVTGDLWYPHVYMTVQNPWDVTGTNAYGRWHYGPWFNPPTPVCVNGAPVGCIENGPLPNEYADPVNAPWEPPMRPGMPNPSMPGESFMDTPLVNGTAYPYMEVEPRAYRFRVLNAANDRFWNLQLYVAADKNADTTATATTPAPLCDGTVTDVTACTEVRMVPVSVAPANQYADTPSGIPDPATAGPKWIQIGTEGGFMPEPIEVPQQPIGYNLDPAYFNFGIVNQHSLWLGAAERADVIVDFSKYAGQTLILYNDSPAPVPAGAAPYDNYTGDGNLMDGGGAPNTLPGYGPNTRTIMQIRVTKPLVADTSQVTLPNLKAVFAKTAAKRGVFEVSQEPVIVPQAVYNSAYNLTFPADASQFVLNVGETQKIFQPVGGDNALGNWSLQPAVKIPFEMKAMHDEMGGVYDTMFGRMSGMLGLTNPLSAVNLLIPYGYSSPPTDIVKGSLEFTPVGQLADGTQLWRIFHNGVDTHPIHTHLFHTQIINRVGQDGQVAPGPFPSGLAVEATDVGWKDTIKVNPLEIIFVALRPTVPAPNQLPFQVPNSVRLIDPILPLGAVLPPPAPAGWFDPQGNPIPVLLNHEVNFGWEYVWHCHILSHEEMDFMHSLPYAVPPNKPTGLTAAVISGKNNQWNIQLKWTDNALYEDHFTVERAEDPSFTVNVVKQTKGASTGTGAVVSFNDNKMKNGSYWYRVWADGQLVGDVGTPGFPTMSAASVSGTATVQAGIKVGPPAAPTSLTGSWVGTQVNLAWIDNATDETGFVVERCEGLNCTTFLPLAPIAGTTPAVTVLAATGAGTTVTYADTTVASGTLYSYRVQAVNGAGASAYSNIVPNLSDPAVPAVPLAPTAFALISPAVGQVDMTWSHDGAANLSGFTIQRANDARFTRGVTSFDVPATDRSVSLTAVPRGTYYYRIRANSAVGSSAWTNGSPFPIKVQ